MLTKLHIQRYKSLFDTRVDLEPLTVFIGPNGSGKSNICEALAVISDFLQRLIAIGDRSQKVIPFFIESLQTISRTQQRIESKFWHGNLDYLSFEISSNSFRIENNSSRAIEELFNLSIRLDYSNKEGIIRSFSGEGISDTYTANLRQFFVSHDYLEAPVINSLRKVSVYDFAPTSLSSHDRTQGSMERTGQGIAYALVDILHANRKNFDELEERLTRLVPNIKRIVLPRGENQSFLLELVDRYSEHHIPASDISDGTLRILAFLTALYQEETPSVICFEEIENGVHPWLLHKMMELLKIVSTEGITGKPVQILITTHSPVLLNYVEPHQVRAVELDHEGKTQVHALPVDSVRFQKAMEAYDGALGELWFSNVFGGNPV
jgi:predicted ATPase